MICLNAVRQTKIKKSVHRADANKEDAFRMYTIIGSRKNYGNNGYKNTKGKLLNGELFENNDERKEIHMIDLAKVKELAKKLSRR